MLAYIPAPWILWVIYLWKRHWWYYKLLTLSTFGSHHVPPHVFSPCEPTWATSRQSSDGLLTQIWTKIRWPQIWFDGLSSFCTFNWQFWIIWGYSQFLRKVWIDTCGFFCHLSGHLLLLHAKPGQTWLAMASCDIPEENGHFNWTFLGFPAMVDYQGVCELDPAHFWWQTTGMFAKWTPPKRWFPCNKSSTCCEGFWVSSLPFWKRWRTWMKWTPFEPRYPTRKVPRGSLWHNTRYTFGANPCQENHIQNQFVFHHHIVLVCPLNNNFLPSQSLHTLWILVECSWMLKVL